MTIAGEDGCRPVYWEDAGDWDERILEVYRGINSARNGSHALLHGGLRWVHADDDVPVFLPESAEQTALAHGARAVYDPIRISAPHLMGVAEADTAYDRDVILGGDSVTLVADRPEVSMWTWPRV